MVKLTACTRCGAVAIFNLLTERYYCILCEKTDEKKPYRLKKAREQHGN